jgi:hypothetical protein
MKDKIQGSIPEKINIWSKDGSIFVTDSTNTTTNETAKRWSNLKNPTEASVPNSPLKNVVIYNLEHRSEGGRAYKVTIDNKYQFDLREDILMDVIKNVGIQAGGKLNGEYIFATVSSQMKLIRVGSDIHTGILDYVNTKTSPALKELVPGTIYNSPKQSLWGVLYLGKMEVTFSDRKEIRYATLEIANWVKEYFDTKEKAIEFIKKNDWLTINFTKSKPKTFKSVIHPKFIDPDEFCHELKRSFFVNSDKLYVQGTDIDGYLTDDKKLKDSIMGKNYFHRSDYDYFLNNLIYHPVE